MNIPPEEQVEKQKRELTDISFNYNEQLPLFVIGAGASADFGYPDGKKLKEQIKELLDLSSEKFKKIDLYSLCSKELEKQEFINACETIRETIDAHSTIDDCIKFHIENKSIEIVGKLAITKLIADLEFNEKSLFKSKNELRIKDSWLDSFFKLVTKHLKNQEAETRLSRIPIAIFNYDRNIEKYMNHLCSKMFEWKFEFSRIFHIYGSLPKKSDFVKEDKDLINWSKNNESPRGRDRGVSSSLILAQNRITTVAVAA